MFFFGSVYPLGKIGTNNIPPILFSSLRVLIIFIGIIPFFKFKLPSIKLILPLLFFSITMGIGVYVTLYVALDISSLVSPIIIGTQLTVPFGLILSFIFLNEKISIKKFFLIIIAFLGVVIVSFDPRIGDEWLALLIISLMAFFYAVANMLSRYLKEIDTISQIGWHSLISCIPLFIISYIIEGDPVEILFPMSFTTFLIILHASLIVSLIGHGSIFYLYKFYPVSTVLPFYSLFPIFGIFFTFLIFYELPNLFEYIGGTIVIGSVYLIHLENKKTANKIRN
jgi:O-acetylserine/cysteine efflux transporter